jgi:hypothetical protein
MNTSSLKFSSTEIISLIIALTIFISLFFSDTLIAKIVDANDAVKMSQTASKEIADLVLSLDKVSLDTKVLDSQFLNNVEPLPQFPLSTGQAFTYGKNNPFSGAYVVVPQVATGTTGGVIYSIQRATSTAGIRAVPRRR